MKPGYGVGRLERRLSEGGWRRGFSRAPYISECSFAGMSFTMLYCAHVTGGEVGPRAQRAGGWVRGRGVGVGGAV